RRFGGLLGGRLLGRLLFRRLVVAVGIGLGRRLRLLGLALRPRRRLLRRLGAAGQDLGDADQRKLVPVAALAARILAPALLEGDHLAATVGVPIVGVSPPSNSTSPNSTTWPGSFSTRSIRITSSAATRYCLPPAL